METLTQNINKLHTTELGRKRIARNISIPEDSVVSWCRDMIQSKEAMITRTGKNWYISNKGIIITINATSYTIITAHKIKRKVEYGKTIDIDEWMRLVIDLRYNFPGLETEEGINEHRQTVLRFMKEQRALCVKENDKIIGVLLFSKKHNMICCLGVDIHYRKQGIANLLMQIALEQLDKTKDITVTTFREDDELGKAPRALYKKYGFTEGDLIMEFGYPSQIFIKHPLF